MAGLQPADGTVTPPSEGPVTLVFQRPAAFSGSVLHNARAALLGRGLSREEMQRRAREALERFEIRRLESRRAHSLSGGEIAFVIADLR